VSIISVRRRFKNRHINEKPKGRDCPKEILENLSCVEKRLFDRKNKKGAGGLATGSLCALK
jgi:hypothetical protein